MDYTINNNNPFRPLRCQTIPGSIRLQPTRHRGFISYHHQNDQDAKNAFSKYFSDYHQVYEDHSLEQPIDSDDQEYISRTIRENRITGTSFTVVLIGEETFKRKHIDWEIKATLDKGHALLGVILPNSLFWGLNIYGQWNWVCRPPDRMYHAFFEGHCIFTHLSESVSQLRSAIAAAQACRPSPKGLSSILPKMNVNRPITLP